MKTINLFIVATLFLGGLTIASCDGEGSKKANPEDEVREFGKYFIEKLAANQLDSLAGMYEDIGLADNILPIQSDTIVVTETGAGEYDVKLREGVTLKLRREDDGKIVVTESFRLFAFPEDKVEIAKKTGMWDESLNDARLAERLNDEEFFTWVKNQAKGKTSNILTVGKEVYNKSDDWGNYGTQSITNNSDVDVDGSDYYIIMRVNDDNGNGILKTKPGKHIPAKGNVKIKIGGNANYGEWVKSIKWKLSPEQIQEKFGSYTGNEYQEYLDSKR